MKYKNSSHEFEIKVKGDWVFEEDNNESNEKLKIDNKFIKVDEILHVENGEIIDLIGILDTVRELEKKFSKDKGSDFIMREIQITDDTEQYERISYLIIW